MKCLHKVEKWHLIAEDADSYWPALKSPRSLEHFVFTQFMKPWFIVSARVVKAVWRIHHYTE